LDENEYVYFIANGTEIKIGYTKNNIKKRLKQLSTGSSKKLYLLGYIHGDKNKEKQLHNQFRRINLEWFNATDELLGFINTNNKMNVYIDWLNGRLMVYNKMIA